MSDRTDPLPEQPPESRPPDREQPTERLTPPDPATAGPGAPAPSEPATAGGLTEGIPVDEAAARQGGGGDAPAGGPAPGGGEGPAGAREAAGRPSPSEPAPGGYAPQEGWRPPAASGPPPGGPPPAGGYQPPGAGGPPPGETGAWRRLTRRMDRRVFAGVASGLGDYFNVDPVVFRVAFVVLSFTGGVGLLLYVALWIMVPPAGAGESIGQAALRRPNARTWIGIGLVLIAVLVLGGELGVQRPGIAWGLVLITLGVVLLIREPSAGVGAGAKVSVGDLSATGGQGQAGAMPTGPAAWGGGPAAAGWGPPPPAGTSDTAGGLGGPPAPGGAAASGRTWGGPPPGGVDTTARAWGEPPPDGWTVRRSRSNLGWVTLAVAFLAVGMAAFLDNVGMVELTIGRVLALFLTVIGIGLVVGAVLHQRSILLVLLGLLLVPVVVLASVLNVPLRGGVGPRLWQPRSVAEIRGQYELASGDLVIDLSGVKFGKEPTRVNARVGIGRVAVYLPQDVPVEMDAKNGVGVVQFPDRQDEGGVQVSTHASAAGSERVGRLSLDLEAGYGLVQVVRGTPPPDTWSRDGHIQGWDGAQRRPPAVEVGR